MPLAPLETALNELAGLLTVSEATPGPGTHLAYRLEGLCRAATRQLGVVLTGLVAQAVALDLEITAALGHDRGTVKTWLEPAVRSVVGADNEPSNEVNPDRVTERDPWIAEAVVHAIALLARHYGVGGLPDGIVARTELPSTVKAPGIDLITLHVDAGSGDPLLCIAETKASRLRGQQRLTDALGFFAGVDQRDHDLEIRIKLNSLSRYVPAAVWDRVPEMLLHTDPHLLPAIFHDPSSGFQWSISRTISGINRAESRVRLLAAPVEPWDDFFDDVADAMRASVDLFGDV